MANLPDGWTFWNDEHEGWHTPMFRPGVFNESIFLVECMPTVFMWNGSRASRPGATQIHAKTWHTVFYLKPEIKVIVEEFDSCEAIVDDTIDIAGCLADGEIDYQGAYQVPREGYFERLDELTRQEP